MGTSTHRHICNNRKCKMSLLLLLRRNWPQLPRPCPRDTMDTRCDLSLPYHSPPPQNNCQIASRTIQRNPHHPMVAETAMVHHAPLNLHRLHPSSLHSISPHSKSRLNLSPRSSHAPPYNVEDSLTVASILGSARKPSTIQLYAYKWSAFIKFVSQHHLPTTPTTLHDVLQFLTHLFNRHLSLSTLKVYLSAIIAHQPHSSDSAMLFQHPTVS